MSHFIDIKILKRNRSYAFLWLGQMTSNFGTIITRVALPFQIYQLTHSTLMIGLLSLCQLAPLLLSALYGGVLADRHHRKKLLIIAELLLAIGCGLLMLNTLFSPKLWVIFLVASLMSALTGLHRPALDSITQQIVEKKDYSAAGALNSFSRNLGAIAGPAVAGLLIVHLGLTFTFSLDLATFMISLSTLLKIESLPKPVLTIMESTWLSLKQGVQYAFSKQEIKGTYFVDFVAMIFGMPIALFPAMAAHYFGGAQALGLLYAAPAVGALILSFFSGWTRSIHRHGAAIAISAALWGLFIIGFGCTKRLYLALFFLALAGAADAVSGIFRDIMWNEIIPPHLFGRLSGVNMISYLSGPKLGDTEAGLVAAAFGITTSIVSGGVLCLISVGICCYFLPKFWHYHRTTALDNP